MMYELVIQVSVQKEDERWINKLKLAADYTSSFKTLGTKP